MQLDPCSHLQWPLFLLDNDTSPDHSGGPKLAQTFYKGFSSEITACRSSNHLRQSIRFHRLYHVIKFKTRTKKSHVWKLRLPDVRVCVYIYKNPCHLFAQQHQITTM